jgi:hypothetical protein
MVQRLTDPASARGFVGAAGCFRGTAPWVRMPVLSIIIHFLYNMAQKFGVLYLILLIALSRTAALDYVIFASLIGEPSFEA